MKGTTVPLVMIPRFTTYTGEGTMESAPLDVAAFGKAVVTFWTGPLVGTGVPPSGATFRAVFEASHDAQSWVEVTSPLTTPSATTTQEITLTRRWLRVKIDLTENADTHRVAITCWAVGSLERRLE